MLLRHPNPPPEFWPVEGQPGAFAVAGRYPAVAANSTREIGGVRTATVMAVPGQSVQSTLLACLEEAFHVFWLARHAHMRPNEMARYAYPILDPRVVRALLAEDEALARAIEAPTAAVAAQWTLAAFRFRRERAARLDDEVRTFEVLQEQMEGTANYVARVAVGLDPAATAVRLREPRGAELIRWRFYESGTALCLILDRLMPDWKARVDRDTNATTSDLLAEAAVRTGGKPAAFTLPEAEALDVRASADVADLMARQQRLRAELTARPGSRVIIEAPPGSAPLDLERFDPINLFVLGDGEVAHPNAIRLARHDGVAVDIRNPAFERGRYAGTVSITSSAGRHPLADGVRSLAVVGFEGEAEVDERDGVTVLEAPGVRVEARGAVVQREGTTVRVVLPRAR